MTSLDPKVREIIADACKQAREVVASADKMLRHPGQSVLAYGLEAGLSDVGCEMFDEVLLNRVKYGSDVQP